MSSGTANVLRFSGAEHFRTRLVLATLTGRPIRIDAIRARDEHPGLRAHEAGLLRLLEMITNGCRVEINETGTVVKYRPGILVCGRGIVFDCGTDRSIGYFAWALALLAPFAKKQLGATLRGVTNDERDATVDVLRTVTVPLLKRFGIEDNLELRIVRRGCPPLGGGEVVLNCPNVRATLPVDLADVGMIKRIRGVAYSSRVSPQMANRMVEAARSVVNAFIPDVYIYTDHFKGPDAGLSPGYGISLVAVSDTGALTSAEACAIGASLPEDIGLACANLLCEDIARSGYVDTAHQSIALILMAFGPEDVSRIRLGALSEHAIATLRHIKSFTGVAFKLVPDRDSGTIVASCLGSGYVNYAKRTL